MVQLDGLFNVSTVGGTSKDEEGGSGVWGLGVEQGIGNNQENSN